VLGDLLSNKRDGCSPTDVDPQTAYVGLEHMPRGSVVIPKCGVAADVTSGKFAFEACDVLFGKLRPYFRKVSLAPENGVCSSDILVLRPRQPEHLPFALLFLSSQLFIDYCDGASGGTRMPRVSWADMSRYSVSMPSGRELSDFNDLAKPTLDRMSAAAVESRSLDVLRDVLLPRLLSGELRVRDAEAAVEEVA
jgi:type I restriction enzyme S subunit